MAMNNDRVLSQNTDISNVNRFRETLYGSPFLNSLPKKLILGLFTVAPNYLCMHACDIYMALGTDVGVVLLYHRENNHCLKLDIDDKSERVCAVSVCKCVDVFVAAATESGKIVIFILPHELSIESTQSFILQNIHNVRINCLSWNSNASKLFSGDANGHVVATEIQSSNWMAKSAELCCEDSPIVQLECDKGFVLISSFIRCIIYYLNEKRFMQIGQKPRKQTGSFGSCFVNDVICASRSGLRIHQADFNGNVSTTYILKGSLHTAEDIPLLHPFDTFQSILANSFGYLKAIGENVVISWNNNCLYIVNLKLKRICAFSRHLGIIRDVSVVKGTLGSYEIFVLRQSHSKPLIRISCNSDSVTSLASTLSVRYLVLKSDNSILKKGASIFGQHITAMFRKKEMNAELNKTSNANILTKACDSDSESYILKNSSEDSNTNCKKEPTCLEKLEGGQMNEDDANSVACESLSISFDKKLDSIIDEIACSKFSTFEQTTGIEYETLNVSNMDHPNQVNENSQSKLLSRTCSDSLLPGCDLDGREKLMRTVSEDAHNVPSLNEKSDVVFDQDFGFYSNVADSEKDFSSMPVNSSKLEDYKALPEDGFDCMDDHSWVSIDAPAIITCLHVSPKHIWVVDEMSFVYSVQLDDGPVMWKPANFKADSIATSQCGYFIWRLLCSELYVTSKINVENPSMVKWTRMQRNVNSFSCSGDLVYVVLENRDVLELSYSQKTSRCLESASDWDICSVKVRDDGLMLALLSDGRLVCRCSYRDDWEFLYGNSKIIQDFVFGVKGSIFAIDDISRLIFATNIWIHTLKEDILWYHVDVFPTVKHDLDCTFLSNSEVGLWYYQDRKIYNNCHTVFGKMWNSVGITVMAASTSVKLVAASSSFVCVQLSSGEVIFFTQTESTSVPMPPGISRFKCLTVSEDSVWALSSEGSVYVRSDVTASQPLGLKWIVVDMQQFIRCHLIHLSCGQDVVWAVDSDGITYQRLGTKVSANRAFMLSPVWVSADGLPSNELCSQIEVSRSNDKQVFAVAMSGKVFERVGISDILPIGTHWVEYSLDNCKQILVSGQSTFFLNQSGSVVYQKAGNFPKIVIGQEFKSISISKSMSLYGITFKNELKRYQFSHVQQSAMPLNLLGIQRLQAFQ